MPRLISAMFTLTIFAIGLFSCADNNSTKPSSSDIVSGDSSSNTSDHLAPTGPKPSWAPDIDPEMQTVIDKLASYGDAPLETLSAQEARTKHSPTDAVMDVMKERNLQAPSSQVDTSGQEIPVAGGTIHARVY